jgi:1,4-dihydroxy-2-naphthoyl-CoA synthase
MIGHGSNAFRPKTVDELCPALERSRASSDVGTVILAGNGPSPKNGGWAFAQAVSSEFAARTATSTKAKTHEASILRACISSRCNV